MSPAMAENFLTASTTREALEYTKPDQTQTSKKRERGLRRKHRPQIIFSLLSRMSRYEFVKAARGRSSKEEEGKLCKSPLGRRRWCEGRTESKLEKWEELRAQEGGSRDGVGTGHEGSFSWKQQC